MGLLWIVISVTCGIITTLVIGQPVPGECEAAPDWRIQGNRVMEEYRGNITLVALMELHCSFCRSQIEGLISLSKMLKNQSLNQVQFVIVTAWNESAQYVNYYKRYLEPYNIKIFQETAAEPVWSKLKGNKDDFFVYDACGRLNYYIPYPQSYLYYHYTISTIYSTSKQEKCGPCRYITSLKIRAYMNVMRGENATAVDHENAGAASTPKPVPLSTSKTAAVSTSTSTFRPTPTPATVSTSTTASTTSTRQPISPVTTKQEGKRGKGKGKTTTTTTPLSSTTSMEMEEETTAPRKAPRPVPTPVLIPVISTGDEEEEEMELEEVENEEKQKVQSTPTSPSSGLDEVTAQIPQVTESTIPTEITSTEPSESEYEIEEYDELGATDIWGTGAVGGVGAPIGKGKKQPSKKMTTTTIRTSTRPLKRTTPPSGSSTMTTKKDQEKASTNSIDQPEVTTVRSNFGRSPWDATRVPKLSSGVDCSSYTSTMCYNQWQEFGTLHSCCQRGVYLTDACKSPLCTNSTYQLCCFQKYQQARFQCCNNDDVSTDRPDDFSRCCYNHFVYDDDGNGDEDDQCCPRTVAFYFWIAETRVAELCLPNVELDLDGIVLEAKMSDKSIVKIPLQESSALQYECPYVNKRRDFFYWEPDSPPEVVRTAKPTSDTSKDSDTV